MNKEWHSQHPMPFKASLQQRMVWHIAHQQNCACRPIPAKLIEQIHKLNNNNNKNKNNTENQQDAQE